MFKKFTTETAIITAGVITAVTTVFNSERTIVANNKIADEKLSALEDKIDSLSNQMNALIVKSNSTTSGPINLDEVKEASLLPTDLLELQASFSISIILFSIATFSALTGLVVNYYINLYGKEWLTKVPTFLKPLIKYYLKITPYTVNVNFLIIFICQFLILLLALYMNFRGIA